jgi:hypothetical protein
VTLYWGGIVPAGLIPVSSVLENCLLRLLDDYFSVNKENKGFLHTHTKPRHDVGNAHVRYSLQKTRFFTRNKRKIEHIFLQKMLRAIVTKAMARFAHTIPLRLAVNGRDVLQFSTFTLQERPVSKSMQNHASRSQARKK